MVAATPPLIIGRPPATALELRSAMNNWGFNTRRRDHAPAEVAERLRWLSENTRPLRDISSPELARNVLEAATSRLDGQRAAPDTVRKHRMLLANAMDYAVELDLLDANPIKSIKWRAASTSTTREIDRRSVVNHRQARDLLDAVAAQQPSGPRLVAFFGLMYYSALRPEEAVNLNRDALELPPDTHPDDWGEIHLTSAAPHAGSNWTNDGAPRETRALKHRSEGESRPVPAPPQLVAILRQHLRDFPPAPSGRLFSGVHAQTLPSTTYMHVWRNARKAALTPREHASPLARRPYDLRHACVSTWLNAGAAPTQVAAWAGHGVDVLLKIYAKCVEGQDEVAKRRIAAALAHDDEQT
jgi:integrase